MFRTSSISLTPSHGYPVLAAILVIPVNAYAAYGVVVARKKYKCDYPNMYLGEDEKNAKLFNCIQRAHQNVLENLPTHILLQFVSSIYRPKLAACMGALRLASFIFYINGYSTGIPQKRRQGAFGLIGTFGMLILSLEVSGRMIVEALNE